ncbi:MAG: hypothetical protein SGILL_006744 [Bacillariaceae sp.]
MLQHFLPCWKKTKGFFAKEERLALRDGSTPSHLFARHWVLILLNIILEDLAQIAITSYVSVVFDTTVTPTSGFLNITTSVYAALIKIVEMIEDRQLIDFQSRLKMNGQSETEQLMKKANGCQKQARAEEVATARLVRFVERGNERGTGLDLSGVSHHGSKILQNMLPGSFQDEKLQDVPTLLLDILGANEVQVETPNEISLAVNELRDEGVKSIAEVLKDKTKEPKSLDLWTNQIGPVGARAVAMMLSTNSSLRRISLGNNAIGDEGAQAIAEALTQNPHSSLVYLGLGYNEIGNEGAVAITDAVSQLKLFATLDLSGNLIGNEGAKALSNLNLSGNEIEGGGAGPIAEALRTCPKRIVRVNLCNNPIEEEGRHALIGMTSPNDVESSSSGCQVIFDLEIGTSIDNGVLFFKFCRVVITMLVDRCRGPNSD